jgi:hypothetical protein
MSDIESAKAVAEQNNIQFGLSRRHAIPPEWAYEAAYEISNKLELGLDAADLNWMARKMWKKSVRKRGT